MQSIYSRLSGKCYKADVKFQQNRLSVTLPDIGRKLHFGCKKKDVENMVATLFPKGYVCAISNFENDDDFEMMCRIPPDSQEY